MNYEKLLKLSQEIESVSAALSILYTYSNHSSSAQALSNLSYQLKSTHTQVENMKIQLEVLLNEAL